MLADGLHGIYRVKPLIYTRLLLKHSSKTLLIKLRVNLDCPQILNELSPFWKCVQVFAAVVLP
jgi:hypothetical protein